MRRPYITETEIKAGTGVVQGSGERKVKAPGAGGAGDFIGVYAWDANEAKAAGEEVGIELSDVVKVVAGGDVTAGKKAVLKDESGVFVDMPEIDGPISTCGTFLQSGVAGEIVEMIVERGSVTLSFPVEE